MAFPTGHNQPAGFVAGQLKDGASFGTIVTPLFAGQPTNFKIDLRYYRSKLIAIVSTQKPDGTALDPPAIRQRQYLSNVVGLALPVDAVTLKALIPLVADEAGLASVGLTAGQNVPTNPTGELIPYELTADGKVQPFVSALDTARAAAAATQKQTEVLTQIASNVASSVSPPAQPQAAVVH